jgi:hypothetical protein
MFNRDWRKKFIPEDSNLHFEADPLVGTDMTWSYAKWQVVDREGVANINLHT